MPAKWSVGQRVLAQWQPENFFYPGTIAALAGNQYRIKFDDGDQAVVAAGQLAPLDVAEGSRVLGRWKGGPHYFPGTVDQKNGPKIHITYDDGDQEWTTISMVRVERPETPAGESPAQPSRVFLSGGEDPEMEEACELARANFRYFWRELAWDRRRIVPALELACVKAPFSDGDASGKDGNPEVEHMWIDEVDFDGQCVSGVLLNAPNWLRTVHQGDKARLPLNQISDWMYAMGGGVCGGYTVNLMRSRMKKAERADHDAAWGLDFGDPNEIRVGNPGEHPVSENMASALKQQLAKKPSMAQGKDKRGWTLLHQMSLSGSLACVKVLLEAGADRRALTSNAMTPFKLARSLGWDKVAAILK